MVELTLLLCVVLASLLLTALFRKLAVGRGLLDRPNKRSSHTYPTPLGGGLGIVVSFVGGFMIFTIRAGWEIDYLVSASVGALFIAAMGLWDDWRPVPALWRLLGQVMAVFWVFIWLGGAPDLYLGGSIMFTGVSAALAGGIAFVWLINLYNFMDGIDGLAGVETISVTVIVGGLLWLDGHTDLASVCWLLAAATGGFLVWNWPPARIFMGDTGSGFLGFMIGFLIVVSIGRHTKWLAVWMILLAVFEIDATVTLLRRIIGKKRWYEAHRSHAYQHAAVIWGHGRVSTWALTLNVIWLFPWAMAAFIWPQYGYRHTIAAFLPLVLGALYLRAGVDGDNNSG